MNKRILPFPPILQNECKNLMCDKNRSPSNSGLVHMNSLPHTDMGMRTRANTVTSDIQVYSGWRSSTTACFSPELALRLLAHNNKSNTPCCKIYRSPVQKPQKLKINFQH